MEKSTWKIIAVIAIILVVAESCFIGWLFYIGQKELDNYNECVYETCKEYPYAEVSNGVCICYEYDILGQLQAADYNLIK